MKKMIIFGVGLLLAAGVVFLAVANKPLSAEEALLLANVEAIAQNEDKENSGYGYTHYSSCTLTVNGQTKPGIYVECEENAGIMDYCAGGCIDAIHAR